MNSLTVSQLEEIARLASQSDVLQTPLTWKRVDIGTTEVYVGNDLYVVAIVEHIADSMEELVKRQQQMELSIVKYLQDEGFIGKDYAYGGTMRIKNIPPDLLS